MQYKKQIALIEDDPLIRDTICGFLAKHNIFPVFEADSFDSGMEQTLTIKPDIILLDIRLGEEKSGIMLGNIIRKQLPSALIIFITSLTDTETLTMASAIEPNGYLVKPFKAEDLIVAIELAVNKQLLTTDNKNEPAKEVFVKNGHSLERLIMSEIVYLQAEGNYVKIRLISGKSLLIRSGLKDFAKQLPEAAFIQIHKSWIINLSLVKSVTSSQIIVATEVVPLSANFRDNLLSRLNIIG